MRGFESLKRAPSSLRTEKTFIHHSSSIELRQITLHQFLHLHIQR